MREFVLDDDYGRADYLLFVDGQAVGAIEAKPAGTTLTGVEFQTKKYTEGLHERMKAPVRPLPFAYESTGVETRVTNGLDPEPTSRRVFTFHRPDTLARWARDFELMPDTPTLRSRLPSSSTLRSSTTGNDGTHRSGCSARSSKSSVMPITQPAIKQADRAKP